jgi:hypothetical protein
MRFHRLMRSNRYGLVILIILTVCTIAGALLIYRYRVHMSPEDVTVDYHDYDPDDYPAGSGVSRVKQFRGMTEDDVASRLGPPTKQREFPHAEASIGYRAELFNWYPKHDGRNQGISFKEHIWEGPEQIIVIWFHRVGAQWLYLNSIKYHRNVRF